MPNIRLIVEYDGAAFHGWQLQEGVPTVQGELASAIQTFLRMPIAPLHASGRTDAGVHARGQVVTFFYQGPEFDPARFGWGVSSLMRGKLSVLAVDIAPDDFHPRESAVSKQYSYRILNRYAPATIERGRVWEVQQPLDVAAMANAAREIIGVHDFSSFRGAGCSANSPVREIFESEVTKKGDIVTFRVVGSGFLQYMVRILTGTLVGLGDGSLSPRTMEGILLARNRAEAGITAPPYGLYLDSVRYD